MQQTGQPITAEARTYVRHRGPCQKIRLSSISNNQGLIKTQLPDSIVDSQKYPLLAIIFALWCQTLVNDPHLKLNCLFSGCG